MSSWIDNRSKSVITLVPNLSEGYNVNIHTDEPIPSDYKRRTHHSSIFDAAQRVQHLMIDVLPGEWSIVRERGS